MLLIANTLFIILILFCLWFVVLSIIYMYKPSTSIFESSQSERQERNDDYNNDYYP